MIKVGLTGLSLAAGIAALTVAAPAPAQARTHVSVGIGIGIPLCCSRPYYDGYYAPPPYYRRHPYYGYDYRYGPPPVAYGPPPVYGPPPASYAPSAPYAPEYSAPYLAPSGQYCREYHTKASIGGKVQDMWGTACQQPDGTWR